MRSVLRTLALFLALAVGAPLVAQSPPPKSPSGPLTYGTSVVTYLRVSAPAFTPFSSDYPYASPIGAGGSRWITGGCGGMCFFAPLQLPAGALLVYLELDFIDNDGFFGNVLGSLEDCDNAGQNCTYHPSAGAGPADCLNSGYICSGNAFAGGGGYVSADLTPDNITVNNYQRTYILGGGNNGTNDGTTQFAGMIVGYVLQVSPDSGATTFNDVPPGSPLHRYVEALFASGITAGCGNGNFCPDNPVTRGQMAVFLAKALGLQWQ